MPPSSTREVDAVQHLRRAVLRVQAAHLEQRHVAHRAHARDSRGRRGSRPALRLHLGRRAVGDLAAEVERDDLVGDAHHQVHVVLDQQHRQRAARSRIRRRSAPQRLDLLVVEAAGRLVEQQQLRLARQRAAELDALLRAERQVRHRRRRRRASRSSSASSSSARAAAVAAPRAAPPAGAARWRRSRCAVRQWPPTSTFSRTLMRAEQRQVLERAADAERGDAVRRRLEQRAALERDPALAERVEARQAVEQRRLAGAVRADQADDLAAPRRRTTRRRARRCRRSGPTRSRPRAAARTIARRLRRALPANARTIGPGAAEWNRGLP